MSASRVRAADVSSVLEGIGDASNVDEFASNMKVTAARPRRWPIIWTDDPRPSRPCQAHEQRFATWQAVEYAHRKRAEATLTLSREQMYRPASRIARRSPGRGGLDEPMVRRCL